MTYVSLQTLCRELGIPTDPMNVEIVRAELKRRLVQLHPDKNGGVPTSEEAKLQFQRLSEAIEFLDNSPQALERLDPRILSMAKQLNALQAAFEANSIVQPEKQVQGESAKAVHSDVARLYRGELIGSGSLAAFFTAILGLSERLPTNPILSPIAHSRSARLTMLVALVGTGAWFCWTWIRERRLHQKMDRLLTEDGLADLTRGCIQDSDKEQHITKRLIADHIYYIDFPYHRFKPIRRLKQVFWVRIPRDLAEHVAEIHMRTLIGRGVVRRDGLKGVEPLFVMDAVRAKEIESDR